MTSGTSRHRDLVHIGEEEGQFGDKETGEQQIALSRQPTRGRRRWCEYEVITMSPVTAMRGCRQVVRRLEAITSTATAAASPQLTPANRSVLVPLRGMLHLEARHETSCIPWRVTEKAPEITACEAITVASVDNATSGYSIHSGASGKTIMYCGGLSRSSAPWPK